MSASRIAELLLSTLTATGCRWALLTGDGQLPDALAQQGDLDVAADLPLPALLAQHAGALADAGIEAVMAVQYDIGRGDAVWLWDRTDAALLHLDVLCDPRGAGRLGVPTQDLLAAQGRATDGWRTAYLVSKRLWKRQWPRLQALSADADADADAAAPALRETFGARAGGLAHRLIESHATEDQWRSVARQLRIGRWLQRSRRNGGPVPLGAARARRVWQRLWSPVGYWAHLTGPQAERRAGAVAQAVGSALPHHVVRHWEGGASPAAMLPLTALRLRPSLLVTWSPDPSCTPSLADAVIASDADPVTDVVDAMSERLHRRGGGGP